MSTTYHIEESIFIWMPEIDHCCIYQQLYMIQCRQCEQRVRIEAREQFVFSLS